MTMKRVRGVILLAVVALIFGGGCGSKESKISDLQRRQAAHLVTEADFAITLRDYPRAESVMLEVLELAPNHGSYWITLGTVRKRMGNTGGTKEAYQRALRAFENETKLGDTDPDPWLKQIYVLALLGRVDDGRKLAEKMTRRFPADRDVRVFVEDKQFDQMLADPQFKESAL